MDKIQVRVLSMLTVNASKDNFLIILSDLDEKEKFGITTGKHEVAHIAAYLFGKRLPTPSLYEVFADFLKQQEYKVKEVCISELNDDIYKAKMLYSRKDCTETESLDIKATDGIALAILTDAPLYATKEVMYKGGEMTKNLVDSTPSVANKQLIPIDSDELKIAFMNKDLQEAIQNEDYEKANQIKKRIEEEKKKSGK